MNKSQMLQDMILSDLQNGKFKPGDPIPSRNQLSRKYKCSRNTVERAVAALKQRGRLVSTQGGATRVAALPDQDPGITEMYIVSGSQPEYAERAIREMFFPALDEKLTIHVIRENDLLRHVDVISHPGTAVIWVMPDVDSIAQMTLFERANVPQLLINRIYKHFSYAATDTYGSLQDGLEWLCSHAGNTCAVVSRSADLNVPYLSERQLAFFRVAAEKGVRVDPEQIHFDSFQEFPVKVSEVGCKLFASGDPPKGIVILDATLTVPLVTLGHIHGMMPGRDYFLLTYDYHSELSHYDGVLMLRQQNEKLYKESWRWLQEGFAGKRTPFYSSVKTELVFGKNH